MSTNFQPRWRGYHSNGRDLFKEVKEAYEVAAHASKSTKHGSEKRDMTMSASYTSVITEEAGKLSIMWHQGREEHVLISSNKRGEAVVLYGNTDRSEVVDKYQVVLAERIAARKAY